MDFVHPNAPAGGCGPGNSRVPGTLCAHASARPLTHVDAPPGGQAHWYDNLPGAAFARHVMAVFEAIGDSYRYLPRALLDATGMELHAILEGILPSLVMMVAILALTTAIGAAAGAALGALAFGVGAVPGAAAGAGVGLEVGTVLLEWLGLAFLVVYIGKSLLKGTKMAASAVALAWHSADQPQALRDASRITAARELANAVAEVFRGVLQGIVAFLLAKGVAAAGSRVPELVANLRKSKLGASFATWVEKNWAALVENPKLKDAQGSAVTKSAKNEAISPSTASARHADKPVAASAATPKRGAYFFDREALPYIDKPDATLGRSGDAHFFMPLEDSAAVTDASSAYRLTGGAPSLERAYQTGGNVYGVEFPLDGFTPRLPTAADTTLPHFLEGGNTALRLPDGGGYLVNPTREFVIPGGSPIPQGSTLFQIGPDGARIPVRHW